jgi:myosin heavy subunit
MPIGIIPTLTEEVMMKSVSDESFINKLHKYHGDKKAPHPHYAVDIKKPNAFIVKHFCAAVTYTVDGFVAKNQDYLHESLKHLLSKSKVCFPLVFIQRSNIKATCPNFPLWHVLV